ncbi:undecaprenyldiphospho-muramoylpentapeptide beta-N-acetylglucosaminyltransferase [Proteiniclasticum sp.]|jgi:UDP-N-acetylglucosamine--N-acetylmuramyl-(pentapeptide) pyrophosphoryl-undecaprenol N-acetylglucosamine transferase|uniref:undecaprenyldiphospho-muramoylpentapeptide beta-N-acetylglucosaminyltransferase n=1 Tax=Proteiniclasticum sp. TaxID=2053595 RepID=UPI00289D29CE|nr:undecaprenyldiphospho-muramoylpentapeptide beta-N-acetylglucosaminyltransferase [Proteiniclasticum sp.]
MKKIIMTGGGTAGHVVPNLAIMPHLKKLGYEIKYIGSQNGIEREIIEGKKIPYFPISSGKLRRYFDWKNFTDPFRVGAGYFQALGILRREKPHLVFSKGGFVSVPVVAAARTLKIPVLAHESDLTPGLANKLALRFVDHLLVTFPDTLSKVSGKGILVGSPIREELFQGNRKKALDLCGFTEDKPVLLFMGGSIGSMKINETVWSVLDQLLENYQIIHLCGKNNINPQYKDLKGYRQFEYVGEEMKDLLCAADFIVARAGSNSIFEFLALRKPHLLIPLSAASSRGDQIENAESFEKEGYSMVLREESLTKDTLLMSLNSLYENKNSYVEAMNRSSLGNTTGKIMELIEKYAK